jgi:hypothetical protein
MFCSSLARDQNQLGPCRHPLAGAFLFEGQGAGRAPPLGGVEGAVLRLEKIRVEKIPALN